MYPRESLDARHSLRVLASGLQFPEGPVALPDGSVLVAEIRGGRIRRIRPDGRTDTLAECGGGPNGLALGPDGALYVCNNGGNTYAPGEVRATGPAADYLGGSIQRVDLHTGACSLLYDRCGDRRLSAPNDLVFDAFGGMYFTDMGKRHAHWRDHGALYYARADGSHIRQLAHGLHTPNGIGLSPDGRVLYVAETETARLWAWTLAEPGLPRATPGSAYHGARLVCGLPGFQRFDSLAVDADGCLCVATLVRGEVTVVSPAGEVVWTVALGDPLITNLCFGGADLRTAYITLAQAGQLVAMDWPRPGLRLNGQATTPTVNLSP